LIRRHDVEIEIGPDLEELQQVVEHLAMLRRHTNDRLDMRMRREFVHHRCHLDRVRARSEHR